MLTNSPEIFQWRGLSSGVQRSDVAGATDWLDAPLSNSSIEQWRMVVIVTECTLFLTSQYDVIFTFPNQRFGEVCWHNIHIQERQSSGKGSSKII